jgi:hypothetical protein
LRTHKDYGWGGYRLTEVEKSLGELAEEINAEHQACEAALRSGLRHAVRAGELLTEAKRT